MVRLSGQDSFKPGTSSVRASARPGTAASIIVPPAPPSWVIRFGVFRMTSFRSADSSSQSPMRPSPRCASSSAHVIRLARTSPARGGSAAQSSSSSVGTAGLQPINSGATQRKALLADELDCSRDNRRLLRPGLGEVAICPFPLTSLSGRDRLVESIGHWKSAG